MDFEAVKSWAIQWADGRMRLCRVKAVLGLVLGPIALALVLTLVYWMSRLLLHQGDELGNPKVCFWISAATVPCLFVANRFTPRRNLMEERMSEGVADSFGGHYAARHEALVQTFLWILFTGPRLFDWALSALAELRRLKAMDIHSCAAVLWLLASRTRKVPYSDLQRELPWVDLEAVLPELRRLPGILFLKTPPPGLGLTQDLRDALRAGRPL
jgi:hypothetical protein